MLTRLVLLLGVLLFPLGGSPAEKPPARAKAPPVAASTPAPVEWEEEKVLAFILAHNPLIRAQQAITREYTPTTSTLRKILERTAVYARAATGTTSLVADTGETTVTTPVTVGIQVSIPLASPKEQRELAEKLLQEATRLDEIRSKVLQDLAQLRQHEAELAAVQVQREFLEAKSQWLQDRVNKGYEEAGPLWDNAQKLNNGAAESKKLRLLIDTQRRQLAQYAGDHWRELLAYLNGTGTLP